jgi:hypothetical protein
MLLALCRDGVRFRRMVSIHSVKKNVHTRMPLEEYSRAETVVFRAS